MRSKLLHYRTNDIRSPNPLDKGVRHQFCRIRGVWPGEMAAFTNSARCEISVSVPFAFVKSDFPHFHKKGKKTWIIFSRYRVVHVIWCSYLIKEKKWIQCLFRATEQLTTPTRNLLQDLYKKKGSRIDTFASASKERVGDHKYVKAIRKKARASYMHGRSTMWCYWVITSTLSSWYCREPTAGAALTAVDGGWRSRQMMP